MWSVAVTAAMLAGSVTAYTDIRHTRFMVKNIDPIVFPGEYRSHMHSFFGSDAVTSKMPTTAELQKGCPSGQNPNDLSVYWIPTLYYHPNATSTPIEVNPGMFSTYYENIDSAEIPFPTNFFAIAGNASAKSQADVDERTTGLTWWCENGPEDRRGRDRALMPRVTCSGNIQVILRFPDCVDTSAVPPAGTNQRWKVAYAAANGGRCPAGMKRIPQLRFSVRYNVRGLIRNGWNGVPPLKLSCSDTMGDGYCFHGDFINGWFDDAQVNLLAAKSRTKWSSIDGARGTGKAGNGGCKPVDRDPTGGTSDYAKSLVMMGKSM